MAKDPRDFLLNTDYEMDKIIFFYEGEIAPDQYGGTEIPHNLGFPPLLTGVWAKTKDFSAPHNFCDTTPVYNDGTTSRYAVEDVACEAHKNTVNLSLHSGNTLSPTIFNYFVRIIGFEPSAGHHKISKTRNYAKKFILNTDHNYLKLHSQGVKDITFDDTIYHDPAPITITHNLGYHPQALFWTETVEDETIFECNFSSLPLSTASGQHVAPAGVYSYPDYFTIYPVIGNGAILNPKLHYRIYYDEAI